MLHMEFSSVEKHRQMKKERSQNRKAESDTEECQLEPVHIKEEKYMER